MSLRKSLKDRTPYHFDFFSVSFGKDYSALYGGTTNLEKKNVKNMMLDGLCSAFNVDIIVNRNSSKLKFSF